MSLELQQAFGLRGEEAIKFNPSYADRGDRLVLKDTWTKGGKAVRSRCAMKRSARYFDRAHRLAGRGSLIPGHRNYRQQLRIYERTRPMPGCRNCTVCGMPNAQQRYEELTGGNRRRRRPSGSGKTVPGRTQAGQRRYGLQISVGLVMNAGPVTAVYLGR